MSGGPENRTVLVLGATGMLGHRVCLAGSRMPGVTTWATVRPSDPFDVRLPVEIIEPAHLVGGLDAGLDEGVVGDRLDEILAVVDPDVVVNAIGVVKQVRAADDAELTRRVNTRFPHLVAERTGDRGASLIHLSTDCVFDGQVGEYDESQPVTATDGYGRSKAAGEPSGPGVLVIRTSMIGRELRGSHGLLEWFLAAPAPVPGFARARFSGLTTSVLADLLIELARRPRPLAGIFHVAADPIDKESLLRLLVPHYRPGTDVIPLDEPVIDRTLDGRRFADATGFVAPSWPDMVAGLAADPLPYDRWRTD